MNRLLFCSFFCLLTVSIAGCPFAKAQAVLRQHPDHLVNIHRQTWESCALVEGPAPQRSLKASGAQCLDCHVIAVNTFY